MHETGFVEVTTAILLIPAVILGARHALQLWRTGPSLAAVLMSIFTLGCLFLLGEEISYGQHVFGWASPEYFQAHNTQSETNLHNLEFVNKGRMKWLLLFGIFLIGVVLPLGFRWYGAPERVTRSALAPLLIDSMVCLPTAAMAMGMHVLVKLLYWSYGFEFHDAGFIDMRETTELYIAYFLFLYPLALLRGFEFRQTIRSDV